MNFLWTSGFGLATVFAVTLSAEPLYSQVIEVRDSLDEAPPIDTGRSVRDVEIKNAVTKVLFEDKTLVDSNIWVQSVNNGFVILAGSATSLLEHARAIEDAISVPGVERVASEIQTSQERADVEISKPRTTRAARGGGDYVPDRGSSEKAKQAAGSAMYMAAGALKPQEPARAALMPVAVAGSPSDTAPAAQWRIPRTDVPVASERPGDISIR